MKIEAIEKTLDNIDLLLKHFKKLEDRFTYLDNSHDIGEITQAVLFKSHSDLIRKQHIVENKLKVKLAFLNANLSIKIKKQLNKKVIKLKEKYNLTWIIGGI